MRYRAHNKPTVRVVWDCPICGTKGGYGGPELNQLCGLCLPSLDDPNICSCLACGWVGPIEDAEITAMEITATGIRAIQ